jgi:hypothetical protein
MKRWAPMEGDEGRPSVAPGPLRLVPMTRTRSTRARQEGAAAADDDTTAIAAAAVAAAARRVAATAAAALPTAGGRAPVTDLLNLLELSLPSSNPLKFIVSCMFSAFLHICVFYVCIHVWVCGLGGGGVYLCVVLCTTALNPFVRHV